MSKKTYLFTSESVSEGHPDKVCDRISDMVVDTYLAKEPFSRVGCETLTTTNKVVLAGETRGPEIKKDDLIQKVRNCIKDIGYEQKGFHWKNCSIDVYLHSQSADIAMGVDSKGNKDEGAGDQGIMFGYACNETETLMPAPIYYSHKILELMAADRKKGTADKLEPDSKSQITMMYENGKGVPQDDKEAAKWFRLAAEQGDPEAQYNLGVLYDEGLGVPQDHQEAVKWLLKSAEQKNLKAQRLIRASYHKLHKEVAEQGDSYAQRFLGDSYYLGLGVTQDYAEAAKWYKKAAEQGDSVSQIILGAMYEKGKGISKDFVEAYKWFSISGETGNGRMYIEKLGKRKMTTAQIAEAQKLAQEWMEKHQKK